MNGAAVNVEAAAGDLLHTAGVKTLTEGEAMDEFRDLILDALDQGPADWAVYVPATGMTLAQWHETMGRLETIIRDEFENPDFCFTMGTIRSSYNRSLTDLAQMIDHQLAFAKPAHDDTVIAL